MGHSSEVLPVEKHINSVDSDKAGDLLVCALEFAKKGVLESYSPIATVSEDEAMRLGAEHIRIFGGRIKQVVVADGVVLGEIS